MKKYLLLIFLAAFSMAKTNAQGTCPGGMLSNATFSSGMTNWSQYGTITTAQVLPAFNGCLANYLAMQATNNSDCGVEQLVNFQKYFPRRAIPLDN